MNKVNRYFDIEVAKKFDTDTAIILHNIQFWVELNTKNESQAHFKDGKYWTYNSASTFAAVFEWLTEKQIRTRLNKLVEEGYLIEGNFNKRNGDRTKWYALTNRSDQMVTSTSQMVTANDQMVTPLPDNKPNNKPDKNVITKNLTRSEDMLDAHKEILAHYNSLFRPMRPSKDVSWVKNANYWLGIYSLDDIKLAITNWYKYPHWSRNGKSKCELSFLFRTKNKNGECNYIEEMLSMDLKVKSIAEIKFDEEFENAI